MRSRPSLPAEHAQPCKCKDDLFAALERMYDYSVIWLRDEPPKLLWASFDFVRRRQILVTLAVVLGIGVPKFLYWYDSEMNPKPPPPPPPFTWRHQCDMYQDEAPCPAGLISVEGECWTLSSEGEDCVSACSGFGGLDEAGTRHARGARHRRVPRPEGPVEAGLVAPLRRRRTGTRCMARRQEAAMQAARG